MKSRRFFLIFLFGLGLVSEASAGDTKILINHIGYDPGGVKQAVIQGSSGGAWSGFKVIEAGMGKVALSGTAVSVGSVLKWKDWHFWTIDFSSLNREGSYFIECASPKETVRSHPFLIQKPPQILPEIGIIPAGQFAVRGQKAPGRERDLLGVEVGRK